MNGFYYNIFEWGFGGWLMMLAMLIFWVLIIAFVVQLFNGLRDGSHRGTHHTQSAIDLLRERYAKGEIEKKEFEEKKNALNEK